MTAKHLQAKVKHHHVWADYLRRWSENGRDVFYTTKTGKIAIDSVRGLSREDHFYQIKPLSELQLFIIKYVSEQSPEFLQTLHSNYLSSLTEIFERESSYKALKEENIDVEKAIYAHKCNILENIHSKHESDASPILSELSHGNISIFDDEKNLVLFMIFLGHQLFRTKNLKDKFVKFQPHTNNIGELAPQVGDAIVDAWWFFSYMLGMNTGYSLYQMRAEENHSLLFNNSSTPFITADQPVVNTHEHLTDNILERPSSLELYYPISPQYAYLISQSNEFNNGVVTIKANVAEGFNRKLSEQANTMLFANTKEALTPYKNSTGTRMKNILSGITTPNPDK